VCPAYETSGFVHNILVRKVRVMDIVVSYWLIRQSVGRLGRVLAALGGKSIVGGICRGE
jgi:hypothetical protein